METDLKQIIDNTEWAELPQVLSTEQMQESALMNVNKHLLHAAFYRKYPDIFIQAIAPKSSAFELKAFQLVLLRILARYQYVFLTMTRGAGKSFINCLQKLIKMILYPGEKSRVIAGGSKDQGKRIASEKFTELFEMFPWLHSEVESLTNNNKDYRFRLYNGSSYEVLVGGENTRGGRANSGSLEECFDMDYAMFDSVIEPMFNVQRKTASSFTDPGEFYEHLSFVTTAGYYSSPFCKHQLRLLENSKANKKYTGVGTSLVLGATSQLPVYFKLLNEEKAKKKSLAEGANRLTMLREYESVWIDFSDSSFFKHEEMLACRTVQVAELSEDLNKNYDTKYWISYDAARSGGKKNDNAVASVFKGTRMKNGTYVKEVVAMYTWHDDNKNNTDSESVMHLRNQARDLKELVSRYNATALIIDAGGLGSGISDFLVIETENNFTGEVYPAYGVVSFNGTEDRQNIPDGTLPILHLIKASDELNNIMQNTLLGHVQSKKVRFLVDSYHAQQNIVTQFDGKEPSNLSSYLYHHDQMSEFIDEAMGLAMSVKNGKVKLEAVGDARKDRFTSVEYGVWWAVKYLEAQAHLTGTEEADLTSFLKNINGGGKRQNNLFK